MTPRQFETAIAQLGLSQVGAARFLDIGERTSRRYISPAKPKYHWLLNIMIARNITPVDARKKCAPRQRQVKWWQTAQAQLDER